MAEHRLLNVSAPALTAGDEDEDDQGATAEEHGTSRRVVGK